MVQQIAEPVEKLLASLEPDNVDGYTVSDGHAFDGIILHGFWPEYKDALEYTEMKHLEDWHIVPIWKP
jgi:hypothetical protein